MLLLKESGESLQECTVNNTLKVVYFILFFSTPLTPKFFFLSCFSMEGFKALGFDPHTMQSSQPMGGPLSPQDALVHLHKLSSMVSQLLQAFSRYLSPLISLLSVTQTTRHCVSLPVCRFLCLIYFSLLFVFKRLYSMFHINIESHDSLYVKGGRLW